MKTGPFPSAAYVLYVYINIELLVFIFCVYSIPRRYYLFLLAFVYCVLFLDLTDMNIVLMSRRSALEYIFIR